MNGAATIDPTERLASLKKERGSLQATVAEVDRLERHLLEAERDLCIVQQELCDFDRAEAEKVTAWTACGCKGSRPLPDVARRGELAGRVGTAELIVKSNRQAQEELAAKRTHLEGKLAAVEQAIKDAAADELRERIEAMGERLKELKAEADSIMADLAAAHAVCAERLQPGWQPTWPGRNQHYQAAQRQAYEALVKGGHPFGAPAPMPERERIDHWLREFEQLCRR